MTTICHSNFLLHRLLTDQGAFIHIHHPEDFEDVGDAESGPQLSGGPAWDEYTGESHSIIVDETGLIVHRELIDWSWCNWVDEMIHERGDNPEDWPRYIPPRRAGEIWQITMSNEDGRWWLQRSQCWTSDRSDAHFFALFDAQQRTAKADSAAKQSGQLQSSARIVHEDECPRCLTRRQPAPALDCRLCGTNLSKIGTPEQSDVERVAKLISQAERDLGKLSEGQRRDLIADALSDWPLDYINHVLTDAAPLLAKK